MASRNQPTYADRISETLKAKAAEEGLQTTADRYLAQSPQCRFGLQGLCCRNCFMGPCRVIEGLPGKERGVCGATASTIVARNFARAVAAGAAAHSDHGRDAAHTLLLAASGKSDFRIKDVHKLRTLAEVFGIKTGDRKHEEIAADLAQAGLMEFGKPEGPLALIKRAPARRQKVWRDQGIVPRAIDREIVEIMHRTTMGVDQDYKSILKQAQRCALADGWGGSMIGTEFQDILFGTPRPVLGTANLNVLKKDQVNVVVHGHEPALAEMIVLAAQDPQLLERARAHGAAGINVCGMCCTSNELLIRHGIPIAGNSMQQELVIVTGAVDAMVVDVQCIMQGLAAMAKHYHTKIITTSPKGHMPGAEHIEFSEERALEAAKAIVAVAVDNFQHRGLVHIPNDEATPVIAGFSHEAIKYMLGGSFRASYRPLNDNIMNGRIRGVVGVVGCNQPKCTADGANAELVKKLISQDILVVQTGCMAIASAKQGYMVPEMMEVCGPGLREVCEAVGMPPVLHAGSCVDNSRILIACTEMVLEGGLGEDISDLPVAGCAPEWMSEKAIAIGQYFVSSGVLTVFGIGLPIDGSQEVKDYLCGGIEKEVGGRWAIEHHPAHMAEMIRAHIESKRDALGINVKRERKLFDMAARRELQV